VLFIRLHKPTGPIHVKKERGWMGLTAAAIYALMEMGM